MEFYRFGEILTPSNVQWGNNTSGLLAPFIFDEVKVHFPIAFHSKVAKIFYTKTLIDHKKNEHDIKEVEIEKCLLQGFTLTVTHVSFWWIAIGQ